MPNIEPSAVTTMQPLHPGTKIGVGRLENVVIMIIHQRIGMDYDAIAFTKFGLQFQKVLTVTIFGKYLTPFQPAAKNVIPSIRNQST